VLPATGAPYDEVLDTRTIITTRHLARWCAESITFAGSDDYFCGSGSARVAHHLAMLGCCCRPAGGREYISAGAPVGAQAPTGAELVATLPRGVFSGTATYTYVRSRELDGSQHLDVRLPPPAQRRAHRDLGVRGRRPAGPRVVLHQPARPRSESLSTGKPFC
jgi:hypothetical protein